MWTLTLLTGLGWGERVFSLSDRMESAESLPQLRRRWRPACLESQPSSQSLSLPLVLGRLEPCHCSLQIVGKRVLWLSDKQLQAIMGGSNSGGQRPTGDHHKDHRMLQLHNDLPVKSAVDVEETEVLCMESRWHSAD